MKCRFCNTELTHTFIDLVNAPASNSFLTEAQLNEPEVYYPLKIKVCQKCFLVQIDEYKKSNHIFDKNYAYFSSFSTSWLQHSEQYVDMICDRLNLNQNSLVVEIASNDGYLLQYFKNKNIPSLGIEPTENTAIVAKNKGIETIVRFFGENLANTLRNSDKKADLIIGNNVLAHVPDLHDFVGGLKILLKENGVITMEFPHLKQLVEKNQFDTIYHEHFSYFSLTTVIKIFEKHNLQIFDVEELPTHGGSLRIYATHINNEKKISQRVGDFTQKEIDRGMNKIQYYMDFSVKVNAVKTDFVQFLLNEKRNKKIIAAYGAAAKGNTLLNYCGIKNDWIDFVVDKSPAKQGKYLPGSHILVVDENHIRKTQPDYVIIFPWNIKSEIMEQLSYIRNWNAKFVIPIPKLEIL